MSARNLHHCEMVVYGPCAMLLSQAGRVRLGNMVDPKYTMGVSILKKYLVS
jgi:hypothetical protein